MLPRAAMNLKSPLLAPLWSSSMSFSKCHAEIKVGEKRERDEEREIEIEGERERKRK